MLMNIFFMIVAIVLAFIQLCFPPYNFAAMIIMWLSGAAFVANLMILISKVNADNL